MRIHVADRQTAELVHSLGTDIAHREIRDLVRADAHDPLYHCGEGYKHSEGHKIPRDTRKVHVSGAYDAVNSISRDSRRIKRRCDIQYSTDKRQRKIHRMSRYPAEHLGESAAASRFFVLLRFTHTASPPIPCERQISPYTGQSLSSSSCVPSPTACPSSSTSI